MQDLSSGNFLYETFCIGWQHYCTWSSSVSNLRGEFKIDTQADMCFV